MAKASGNKQTTLLLAGREVTVTNPDKIYFPTAGYTKLDLVRYYVEVAEGALRGIAGRPIVMKRYVDGAEKPAFYQKRAPEHRPDWIETVELRFPSGRTAVEVVVRDVAQLIWLVNLGCIDLHPHLVRADDLDHPDELRIDLDPVPGVPWSNVTRTALVCRDVLAEHGLRAWPKTSGSRGMHLNVRIERRWSFPDVRRAALALAREVERREPALATSAWWKEERHGVFIDYNQNAKDRTTAAAYSVRPTPDARVSAPLDWDEVADCDPAAFTLKTMPARLRERGDPAAGIDGDSGSLDSLLALSDRQLAAGMPDAPWPPHYEKQAGEAPRVMPSRRRRPPAATDGAGGKVPSSTGRRRGRARTRDHHRPRAGQGCGAGRARALEGPPPGGGRAPGPGELPGGLHARPLVRLDARAHRPEEDPARGTPRTGAAGGGRGSLVGPLRTDVALAIALA